MEKYSLKHYIVITFSVIFVGLILSLIYFTFIDGVMINKPIEFDTDPLAIVTEKPIYKRGEVVRGYLEFCKTRNIPARLQWSLIDHFLTIYPAKDSYTPIGCKQVTFNIEVIPKTVVPEKALHFEGLIQYRVNPFSIISVPLRTNDFEVQ